MDRNDKYKSKDTVKYNFPTFELSLLSVPSNENEGHL